MTTAASATAVGSVASWGTEPGRRAVLKDSRGGEVARGTAQLGFKATGPAGYCGFDPVPGSDIACLNCSSNFPDEFGGPFSWSVCFTI